MGELWRNLDEAFARFSADALGGRIGRDQLGMLASSCLQPPHHHVVFGVADFGLVQHVIQMFVMAQRVAQFFDFPFVQFWRASTIIRVLSSATGSPFSSTILSQADSGGANMRSSTPWRSLRPTGITCRCNCHQRTGQRRRDRAAMQLSAART